MLQTQDKPHLIRHRIILDVSVIAFETHYLQSEADIAKVTAELFDLVDREEPKKLLLSFNGVRFVSSSMLAQVVKLHNRLAKAKRKLRVCGLAPQVREVIRASNLDKLLEVFDDEAKALAKF